MTCPAQGQSSLDEKLEEQSSQGAGKFSVPVLTFGRWHSPTCSRRQPDALRALRSLSPWAFGPRKPMKNGHNDMLEPIRAIPFVFSTTSFLASGFSTPAFAVVNLPVVNL